MIEREYLSLEHARQRVSLERENLSHNKERVSDRQRVSRERDTDRQRVSQVRDTLGRQRLCDRGSLERELLRVRECQRHY